MVINGKFNNNELSLDGELEINEDGSSNLKVNGEYKYTDTILTEEYIFNESNEEIITLKHVRYNKKSSSESMLKPRIVFITNKQYKYELEEINLKEMVFSLNNIDGFFTSIDELASKSMDINYQDFNIKLSFKWDYTIGRRINEIKISSSQTHNLIDYQKIVYSFVTFISFAIGDIANQQNMYFIDENGNKVKIYYKPSFYKENGKAKQSILFNIDNQNIQQIYQGWNNLLEITEPIIPLYFMPYFFKIDLNVKYVLLTQALEAFHRKITRDNSKNFIDRVKDIIFFNTYERFLLNIVDREELENLSNKIRTTRNYLTHYNVNQTNEILEGREKIFTCIKLELFIDLYLLQYIGFSEEDFESIYDSVIKDRFDRENVMSDILANK